MVSFEVPAALDPVGRGHLDADRLAAGKHRADRVEHFQRIAQPVLQAAAILVGALVGTSDRLMQEVAVRAMQFERVDAEAIGASGRRDEGVAHPLQALRVERQRRQLALLARQREGASGSASPALGERDLLAAVPWRVARSLAAGMRSRIATAAFEILAHRGQDRPQRGFGGVVPQPEAARRDAAARLDMGGLDAEHRRARQRQRVDMGRMPVIGLAVLGRILAHRRHR